ncbi:MAG: Flp pilus assembly protein CpaB [Chloroflexi bacterium]|nr:Flp pilus assembly protein CpaB [Chloroflexota bacterium]
MQRGRLFILLGLLLLLGTAALFLVLSRFGGGGGGPTPTPEGATPAPQVEITQVVIAVQPLSRGQQIPPDAVALAPWPTSSLPGTAMTDVTAVVGKLARYDIERGEPILSTLVADDASKLSSTGSEAALRIPPGKVAITIPMTRLSGVGYGLAEGDHVNVLASLMFVDLNETTQTILPDDASVFTNVTVDPVTGSLTFSIQPAGPEGVVEFSEGQISIPFLLQPSEEQRPRLVVQQVVQDAIVLKVGTFTDKDVLIALPTATPLPEGSPPPPPTAIPPPDIVTLIVSPQDSLVVNYFLFANAKLTLALRSAGDTSRVDTESVTLQYAIEHSRISVPAPLAFGLEPAVRQLKPPKLPNEPPISIVPLPDGTYICIGVNCP